MTKQELDIIQKWMRNKEGLGFSCVTTIDGKKISIKFKNLEKCYEKAANELCNKVIKIGIKEINDTYKNHINFDDQNEIAAYSVEFAEKNNIFLNTLLNRGYEIFHTLVNEHAYVFGMKRNIAKLSFKHGKWVLPNNKEVDISQVKKII